VRFSEERGHQEHEEALKVLYENFLDSLSPVEQPLLIAIGGSPGAGKTTFRKACLKTENVHLHDMDEVMVRLPGYQEDLKVMGAKQAFEKWWPTAREMAQTLVLYAIQSKYSIIYDRTCGAEGSYFDLLHAKSLGYHIRLIGLYVDKDVAKGRTLKREQEEGRCITEAILNEYRARFSALWPYYLALIDEVSLYQTNEETPALIFSSKEGVQDLQTYQLFLEEGEPFQSYLLQRIPEKDERRLL
jgi:predicted ABC-type ATPase